MVRHPITWRSDRATLLLHWFGKFNSATREAGRGGGGEFPINGSLGMGRWMGSHCYDSTDCHGVVFSSLFNRVTRMGSQVIGTLRVRKSFAQK